MKPVLEISNLNQFYGKKQVLDSINLTINSGEIVGLLGVNGAGKTTLIKSITGLLPVYSGKILVNGKSIDLQFPQSKKDIGYLPDMLSLYVEMTIEAYLRFICRLKGIKNHQQEIARVSKLTQITNKLKTLISSLSKGYRQRVSISATMIGDPKCYIFDEPLIGLDPKQVFEIRNLIASLGETKAVFFSSHILKEIQVICNKIAIINEGKVIAFGNLKELKEKVSVNNSILVRFLEEIDEPFIYKLQKLLEKEFSSQVSFEQKDQSIIFKSIQDKELYAKILTTLVKNNLSIVEFTPKTFSIEDIFLKNLTN